MKSHIFNKSHLKILNMRKYQGEVEESQKVT